MITDLNYLEAGMSEEFSDAINPENVVVREAIDTIIDNLSQPVNEGIKDVFGGLFNKNKKSTTTPIETKSLPVATSDRIKLNKEFIQKAFKEINPIVNRLIKKYPDLGGVVTPINKNDDSINDFIKCNYDELVIADYDLWDHKDVKAQKVHPRELFGTQPFDDAFTDFTDELCGVINALGYGKCECAGDWDDGPYAIFDVFDSIRYKEFESQYIKKHPNIQLESTTGEPELANLDYTVKEVNDTEDFFNPSTLEKILADSDDTVEAMINKLSSNGLFGLSESANYHSVNDTDYMQLSAYESYLENTIDNELRLNKFLTQECGLLESSNIILEARIQDTIKNKWEVFKNFILRVSDRFKEAIGNILDQNRKYLERYKKQILEVQPSDKIEVSYNGDYPEAQDRCLNTPLPVFNYERDAQWLRQDGLEGTVKDFMAGKSFKYVEGEDLAGQFKNWFLASDSTETKTKLSSLNFKQMYDFCYNSNKLINSINRDIKSIDQSTNQLLNAVNKEMRERGEKTQQNQAKNPQTQTTPAGANNNTGNNQSNNTSGSGTSSGGTNTSQSGGTSQTESGLVWMNLHEADEAKNGSGLTISTPTNDVKDDNGNTTKETSKAPGKTNTTEQDMTYITGKWVQLCRSFLTAKLTITQQIARDYMNLIKTHLRSQNIDGYKEPGQGKDNKENNNQEQNKEKEEDKGKQENNTQQNNNQQ